MERWGIVGNEWEGEWKDQTSFSEAKPQFCFLGIMCVHASFVTWCSVCLACTSYRVVLWCNCNIKISQRARSTPAVRRDAHISLAPLLRIVKWQEHIQADGVRSE